MSRKLITIFFLLVVPLLSDSVAQTSQGAGKGVVLIANRKEVFLPCEYRIDKRFGSCPDGTTINLRAKLTKKLGSGARFLYEVSGGEVVGSGSKVQWDMSKLNPGTYAVLVKVFMDPSQLAQSERLIITVWNCEFCTGDCICPTINVKPSRSGVDAGGIVNFAANILGLDESRLTFKWKVTNGKIIKGDKTKKLTVRASKSEAGKKLIAMVEIGGLIPACACINSASETVDILLGR